MIRILEIAWLVIALVTAATASWQLYSEGFQSALWMMLVTGVSFLMYMIRRKQRIRFDRQMQHQRDETAGYH